MNFLEIFCAFLIPHRRRIHPFTRLTEINRLTVIRSILHNVLLHLQEERDNSVFFYEKSFFCDIFCHKDVVFLYKFFKMKESSVSSVTKLLQIMKILLQNRYATVPELSERLGISTRTLYRYLKDLRKNGFMVKKEPGNVYRLDVANHNGRQLSDLLYFTEEEAYLLKSAIESIDETNVLKQNLKRKLYSIYDCKMVADIVLQPRNRENVHDIVEAIENKRQVVLHDYHSSSSNKVSDRLVEPFALTANFVQVWCYDLETKEVRFYKTSRIGSVEVLSKHWQYESLHQRDFEDVFRMHGKQQLPVKLKMSLRAANLLREEYPLADRFISQLDSESWIFDAPVANYAGISRFVLGLYEDIEILESDGLKDFVRQKINRMILL